MLAWWTRRAAPRLSLAGAPEPLAERVRRLAEAGIEAELYDITGDVPIPTVFCVLRAGRIPFAAVELARAGRFGEVHTLADHAHVYAGWRETPAFDFLRGASAPQRSFADFAAATWWRAPADDDELRAHARALEVRGLTVLDADLTVPEAAALGCVVRTLVPELLPLSPDHGARWLATPRLVRALAESGAEVNPFPHPFA